MLHLISFVKSESKIQKHQISQFFKKTAGIPDFHVKPLNFKCWKLCLGGVCLFVCLVFNTMLETVVFCFSFWTLKMTSVLHSRHLQGMIRPQKRQFFLLFPVTTTQHLSSLHGNQMTSMACDSLRIPFIPEVQPKWLVILEQFQNGLFQWRYEHALACCFLCNVRTTKGEFWNCLGRDSLGDWCSCWGMQELI